MGPAYFVIAIMGCADGSQACTQVTTMPAHYATQESCAASVSQALAKSADLDFPTLVAECQAVKARPAAVKRDKPTLVPASARRG